MQILFNKIDSSKSLSQLIPLALTLVVFIGLIGILHMVIALLNLLPFTTPILLTVRWYDVLVGGTIYLKTSIDFAILMGRLMSTYPGWRGRIAIEIGTAAGNALGTMTVIALWVLLKHVDALLALMVFIASLVLFELAHGSLEHLTSWESIGGVKQTLYRGMHLFLDYVNRLTSPVLSRIMPDIGENLRGRQGLSWKGLIAFSMTVPFILGLDDFAGYVPLFSVVNVYGFSIGVIGAHTILNIALFLSPERTIQAVKNEIVSFLGAFAFIALAFYGLFEAGKIIVHLFG